MENCFLKKSSEVLLLLDFLLFLYYTFFTNLIREDKIIMGLLHDLFHNKAPSSGERRCINCSSCTYIDRDRRYTCSNGWAPLDYTLQCKRSPNEITNCPKFNYKG